VRNTVKNISEAFTFIFKDPDWSIKILMGALFTFLSIFLIGIPVVYGYYIELIQRQKRGEKYPLPDWKDVGVKFILGLKYLVTLLIYYIPLMLILIPIFFMILLYLFQGMTFLEFADSSALIIIIFLAVLTYSLIIALMTPIISIQFAERESIGDGLRIGRVVNLFKQCWQDVIVVVALCFAIDLLAGIGIIFFIVGILFTSFYVSLVRFHLYGQIAISLQKI